MKIGLIPNVDKDIDFQLTKEVAKWLIERGISPCLLENVGKSIQMENFILDEDKLYGQCDFLIVLGGDGTILRVARQAALHDKPLLGVNLGTLGYLTDASANDVYDSVGKVLNGKYVVEKRMMLDSFISEAENQAQMSIALNEVCISRVAFSTMMIMELKINDEFIDNYRCDGLIISTPTGSTAYNLSAGGSILKPDSEMIAITPICPHMIYARPIVINACDEVKIKLLNHASAEGIITQDGQNHSPFLSGQTVVIKRSKHYTSIMKTNEYGFFDVLRQKMYRPLSDSL